MLRQARLGWPLRGHDGVYVAGGFVRNPIAKQKNTLGLIAQGISDVP